MNLRSKQTKQTSKFKELTTKEKIEYIWDYYHLHILGALFGALLLTMFIYSWVTGNGYYEDCYFGILAQAPSMEVATDFAEYILR